MPRLRASRAMWASGVCGTEVTSPAQGGRKSGTSSRKSSEVEAPSSGSPLRMNFGKPAVSPGA
ncbi:MAG: hypothetical protein QM765_35865 [Myxococcales bacterium]